MKDAKGHGSDPRDGIAAKVPKMVPIGAVKPRENISEQMGGWSGRGAPPKTTNPVIASQIALVSAIRDSIRAGHPIEPLVIRPNGTLIEGHHRLLAFRGENASHVPVVIKRR